MKFKNKLRILVTRPKPQGEELCALIREAGGIAIYFPVIEIEPLSIDVSQLSSFDWLIFTSPQAVLPIENHSAKIAAIGESTANALKAINVPVDVFPKNDWNSEGLLALPEFQQIENKKIAILGGEGGRELLEKELAARGAHVTKMNCYRRVLPNCHPERQRRIFSNRSICWKRSFADAQDDKHIDIIVCTSCEAVTNLKKLTPDFDLTKIPLCVTSERIQTHAQETGFEKIFLAKNASHHAILEKLIEVEGILMSNQPNEKIPRFKAKFLWIFILLIALAGAGYAGYFYLFLPNQNALENVSTMTQRVQQIEKNVTEIQQQDQQISEEFKNQSQALTAIQQTQNTNKDMWSVLEAQYLVKLANYNVQFENNIPAAISLLQTADQEIQHLSDPKIATLRQSLATDIAALQSLTPVDTVGIYSRLSALNEQVDKLPLPTKITPNNAEQSVENKDQAWWKVGLHQTWLALQKIVVVRYNPKGSLPLVTPEEQNFLYQNLHAVLANSIWAVLHKQPDIYRSSLQRATDWTKKYFLQDSPITQAMLNELNALQQIEVRPVTTKTLDSVTAFQDYFK